MTTLPSPKRQMIKKEAEQQQSSVRKIEHDKKGNRPCMLSM